MTPAQVGLIWGEHRTIHGSDRAQSTTTSAPQLAQPEEGKVSDLAYWASLPLRG